MVQFQDPVQVIRYLDHKNPTRTKLPSRFERVSQSNEDHASDWTIIASATHNTLRKIKDLHPEKAKAFELRHMAPEDAPYLSAVEIAKMMKKSRRQIYYYLDDVEQELRKTYERLGIMRSDN